MSEFLGATISLISKSDIRYVGVLHEINSEESTVSLENVRSWGTEGRKGNPAEEIPPSAQIYEYIVFRGSDVKDLRIEESPSTKDERPSAVPDDPAIVGARPRPGNNGPPALGGQQQQQQPPPGPGNFSQNPWGGNNFYPPPMGGWGRGNMGPGPGPGFYPPPPGYMPQGQFPPGPGGPGPWNNNFGAFPPGPPGPMGPGAPGAPGQANRPGSNAPTGPEQKAPPAGPASDNNIAPSAANQMQSEPKSLGQGLNQQAKPTPPTPPTETKPSVEEVKSTAASITTSQPPMQLTSIPTGPSAAGAPTGPKATRPVVPAVPVTKFTPPVLATAKQSSSDRQATNAVSQAAMRDATQTAKAAVAAAMSKMEQGTTGAVAPTSSNGPSLAMDNLTRKVNEMRVNATRGGPHRGRGRGARHTAAKVEVPDTDFDFASANAKFKKEEVLKEAAASPPTEVPSDENTKSEKSANSTPAYDKKSSFFDNISSESKERAENGGQKPGGREWRGEEQRRNIETFGSPSVDNGYRPGGFRGRNPRGRGRGRGYGPRRGGNVRSRENLPA